ncbi:DUF4393 domain-containing protein [Acinetobacter pittii]|uniref:DUF4393 domain-containing protein n=1 Tax=Acinetobacter pittii TaxID=48296 RepID=UPI00301D0DC8
MEIKDLSGLGAYSPILHELYKDMAQPAARNVGLALGAITSIGLFLHLLTSWGTERINLRLKDNLEKYADRLKDFPEEEIVQAPPEVAMPIMEKLSYVTNEELKELYIELLAKASIKDLNDKAHPSFVNIINNLSPDEAKLIKYFNTKKSLPFVNIHMNKKDNKGGFLLIEELVILIPDLELTFNHNLSAYFSNLAGAGLLEIDSNHWYSDDSYYIPYQRYLEDNINNYELHYAQLKHNFPNKTYEIKKGMIRLTMFGKIFFSAILK